MYLAAVPYARAAGIMLDLASTASPRSTRLDQRAGKPHVVDARCLTATAAFLFQLICNLNGYVRETGLPQQGFVLVAVQGPGHAGAPRVQRHVRILLRNSFADIHHVGHRYPAPGFEHPV